MLALLGIILFILIRTYREGKLSSKNENWLKMNGAKQYGEIYYKWHNIIYYFFIISFIIELVTNLEIIVNIYLLAIFIILQWTRHITINSLNNFFNRRMLVIPNLIIIRRGIYKWIKHPYDFLVLIELIMLPLIFELYLTAIVFPFLYSLLYILKDIIVEESIEKETIH